MCDCPAFKFTTSRRIKGGHDVDSQPDHFGNRLITGRARGTVELAERGEAGAGGRIS